MSEIVGSSVYSALYEAFRRYLFTAHRIADTEPELREAFWEALGRQDFIAREPILSTIPAYQAADTPRELASRVQPPYLHPSLLRLGESDRPLYRHQVSAIQAVQEQRSVAIATGTGSGKTESFVLPILDDVLRRPSPGVRALIVYPLNALANDQLRRLRQLLRDLPEVTFGRYTGESPHTRRDLSEAELAEVLDPNERVARDELRAAPPHIVLTNFAMLEYLLLRPQDSPLFSAGTLRYVVLDEAHVYQGAQGIDVGLLMRRLNARVGRPLQYVLTSATLGGDVTSVQQFAYTLTGASVAEADIVRGVTTTGFVSGQDRVKELEHYRKLVPTPQALERWASALSSGADLAVVLKESGLGHVPPTSQGLYEWLCRDRRLATLHGLLAERPRTLTEVSRDLWDEDSDEARLATEWLCLMGARATRDEASSPLLAARYHLLTRGLRGATLCVAPGCPGRSSAAPSRRWSHLMLETRSTCERCDAHVVPLAACFTCGLPVFRVRESSDGEKWQQLPSDGGAPKSHLLTWAHDGTDDDEDGAGTPDQQATLCLGCRAFTVDTALVNCCVAPQHVTLRRLNSDDNGHLKRCPRCGSDARKFPSVVREFATGEDAAGAVLLEELLRKLPEENPAKPAGARRVLAFSDSRQRAAFFAPFLARTTAESQVMAPLLDAIDAVVRQDPRGATIDAVSQEFARRVARQPFVVLRRPLDDSSDEYKTEIKSGLALAADDRAVLRRDAKVALLRHLVAAPRRKDSLPGLALATCEYDLSELQGRQLEPRLRSLSSPLGASETTKVLQSLVRVVVRRQAIQWPDDVHPSMLGPSSAQRTFHRSDAGATSGRDRVRWNSYLAKAGVEAVVRRSPQVAVLAASLGIEDPVGARATLEPMLEEIWEALRDTGILTSVVANEYVIASDRLVIVREGTWMRCVRCSAVVPDPPSLQCPMAGCSGELQMLDRQATAVERDHQRRRFTDSSVLPLNVREHTAQLTQKRGRDYQRDFTEGLINVLSCSTTFEMGVDVGQLRAVYLRNVPPTAANYIQRAGRAGRRREGVALALTFARNLPHDQANYYEPGPLLSGMVTVPRVGLRNKKLAQRHANAWILSAFVAASHAANDNATLGEFFFEPSPTEAPQSLYGPWVSERSAELAKQLADVISDSALSPAEAVQASVYGLAGVAESVASEAAAFERQIADLDQELRTAPSNAVDVAKSLARVRGLRDDLMDERLIDRLSSEHWLPSYAFPQDVVRLRVLDADQASRYKLERDAEYGISEYAPGAEVVADGRLIRSAAVDFKGRTAHLRRYRICRKCNNVEVADSSSDMQGACVVCGGTLPGVAGLGRPFIVPKGFSTVFEERTQEVRLSRLLPPRSTEVFLVRGAPPDSFASHSALKGLQVGLQADGQLFLANAGHRSRGYVLCLSCGRHVPKGGAHRTPWGSRCQGTSTKLDLAYEFETDTLQIRFDGVSPRVPPITDVSFWASFEMATISAASEYLEIAARDISATHRAQKAGGLSGELVIYDRVPGGAGYVARIVEHLPAILQAALDRVKSCKNPMCDIQGCCDACLRSYYNQMSWDKLKRQVVLDWLDPALRSMTS